MRQVDILTPLTQYNFEFLYYISFRDLVLNNDKFEFGIAYWDCHAGISPLAPLDYKDYYITSEFTEYNGYPVYKIRIFIGSYLLKLISDVYPAAAYYTIRFNNYVIQYGRIFLLHQYSTKKSRDAKYQCLEVINVGDTE